MTNDTEYQLPIWYLLVNADGTSFSDSTVDRVFVTSIGIIADFRDAVKKKNDDGLLKGISAASLRVFKEISDLNGEPLRNSLSVLGLGGTEDTALFVVVPDSRTSSRSSYESNLYPARAAKRPKLDVMSLRWQSFLKARVVNGCIVSADGALLPLIQDAMTTLFVRRCYSDVFNLFLQGINEGRRCFGVSGTPGIGKSLFFVYILFRIVNDSSTWKLRHIVYQREDRFECIDLVTNEVYELGYLEQSSIVQETGTLYVLDGAVTRAIPSSCVTIFLSSPRSESFQRYVKQRKAKTWYFPVWTWAELTSCRNICYPLLPCNVLENRFTCYGGIARFAFYDYNYNGPYVQDDPTEMETALADVNAVKSLRSVGSPTKMFESSHTLLHMIVGSNYKFLYVDLASKYVGEQLWDRHYYEMITNLKDMFGGSPNEISRHLFEIYGHRIFSKGGKKLKCRNLEDSSESELVLDVLDGQRTPMTKEELPPQPLVSYYEPSDDDQFPSIDSISKQGMFQFTVGSEHPIRGVIILKQLCNLYNEPKLFFVVPPHRYCKFKKQKFLEKQGNSAVQAITALKQYVLELEV